jgi:lipooligosaccharide transport system permease protein
MTAVVSRETPSNASGRHPALRVLGYMLLRYKRTWRGTLTESFLYPLFFLVGMGIGLGHLVNRHVAATHLATGFGGASYVMFIAPGVLAATAMQLSVGESTYPVLGGIRWERTYHAMLAAPIRVRDILSGQLCWVGLRVGASSAIFLAIIAAFGDVRSPLAVLALPAAVLTGLAFAAPVTAFSATREQDNSFAILFRLGIIPLFLFSGTFFPITQLPGWLQSIARVTPLYQAVELCRGLVLGGEGALDAVAHTAYLVALVIIGVAVGRITFERRLSQ